MSSQHWELREVRSPSSDEGLGDGYGWLCTGGPSKHGLVAPSALIQQSECPSWVTVVTGCCPHQLAGVGVDCGQFRLARF